MKRYIVLQKYDPSYNTELWKNITRKNTMEYPVQEVVTKYSGFEGDVIAFQKGGNFEIILKLFDEYSSMEKCELIFVTTSGDLEKDKSFRFIGYDYGACDEEILPHLYSSIFNEILFGIQPLLIEFKDILNEHLLFETKTAVEDYVLVHLKLHEEKADVEDQSLLSIYEIWKYT